MIKATSADAGQTAAIRPREEAAAPSAREKAKSALNASILQASMSVAIGAGNEPMALLYKTALNGINEALEPDFGPNAIQNAASQDNTPEATAGRIVSMSTGFFEAYKRQNPGQDEDVLLQKFMDKIEGGVKQGFKEARDILEGLGVLKGELAGNIDKTEELVRKGMADFISARRPETQPGNDVKTQI